MSSTRSRSPPALNAPSAPRTITERVSSSLPIVFQISASSRCIDLLTALSFPSARSVSRRTCSAGRSSSSEGNASYTEGTLETVPVMVAHVAEVEVTRDGPVLTITLNRPDVLNALNKAVHDQLHAALRDAADPSVRAVVITGAGRGFCVGQDLQDFSAGAGSVTDNLRQNYHETVRAIRALQKPVIAAVNGPAAGAGGAGAPPRRRRGDAARARVRRAWSERRRELRSRVHQDRPRAGLRGHVARAARARHGAR